MAKLNLTAAYLHMLWDYLYTVCDTIGILHHHPETFRSTWYHEHLHLFIQPSIYHHYLIPRCKVGNTLLSKILHHCMLELLELS